MDFVRALWAGVTVSAEKTKIYNMCVADPILNVHRLPVACVSDILRKAMVAVDFARSIVVATTIVGLDVLVVFAVRVAVVFLAAAVFVLVPLVVFVAPFPAAVVANAVAFVVHRVVAVVGSDVVASRALAAVMAVEILVLANGMMEFVAVLDGRLVDLVEIFAATVVFSLVLVAAEQCKN